jgi:hypothetical protein
MRATYWHLEGLKFSVSTCPKTGKFVAIPAPDINATARHNRQKRKAKHQKLKQISTEENKASSASD